MSPAIPDERAAEGLEALPEILARAGSKRVLLITGESGRHVDLVRTLLAGRDVEVHVFQGARRHVPEAVVRQARELLANSGADTIVALGGGSAIGLGKALRLDAPAGQGPRFVAIPTTYAGSERTGMYGITAGGTKTTGRDPRVRPDAVVYDVELTAAMPKALTVTSLMNALAHPVSTLGAGSLEGEARAGALRAIEILYGALEALVRAPGSRQARAEALEGAGLAAQAIEAGKPGLHHQLAHRLGGRFDLDHSGLHSVLLPHTVRRLRDEAPAVAAEIDRCVRVPDLEAGLFDLLIRAGAATSLKALGVTWNGLRALLEEAPELPGALLSAAFHGRRPSVDTRLEDWGLPELVSVRGPALEAARRVVVAVHGRGATADSILGRAVELTGNDPGVAVIAPQAPNNSWYTGRYAAPQAELGAELEAARRQVAAVLDRAIERSGDPARVALFGFSQGGCLALDLFAARGQRLGALVALSGAAIGTPDEQRPPGAGVRGTPVLLGASAADPYLGAGDVERAGRALLAAGCWVTVEMVPGDSHGLHARHRLAARPLLRGVPAAPPLGGFGNAHESEALPGALPRDRNSPHPAPYGLYAEQVSGTGFVTRRHDNRRTWTYRIRPSAQQGPLAPLAHATFAADFAAEAPDPNLLGFRPLPVPDAAADFVDGLCTVGGAGSPGLRRGFAVHVYAANRGMEERCFANADGEMLILPELGGLTLLTELGALDVEPGQLALVPRGLRVSVLLRGPRARGYVAEVYGRSFELPERGPVGANGLTDARHFRAPAAFHEDRLAPGFRVTVKLGGALHEATQDFSPFDVAAWHGNHCPYVYDLAMFAPVGNTRVDHGDPSIYTVLSAPLDEPGANGLDLVVFPPRWDPTERTFRPPYFHRNATTEINGIVRDDDLSPGSPFAPGCLFVTPSMTPHGVRAGLVERALAEDAAAQRPVRMPDGALWFQFETTLPFALTPWARGSAHRITDWPLVWGVYRKHFRV
jgi:homogentisate 1,2-dioxygenase